MVHVNCELHGAVQGNTGGSVCRRVLNTGQCSAGELSGGGGGAGGGEAAGEM